MNLSKFKTPALNAVRGAIIGTAMLIPGVSGGTTAIILGIYNRLVSAVGSIFKNFKKSMAFLIPVGVGGLAGIWLFSKPLLDLTNLWFVPMLGLFFGAVMGSLPLLLRKATKGAAAKGYATIGLYIIIGAGLVLLLSLLPRDLFSLGERSFSGFIFLAVAGVFLAVALVLPGISFSHMLYVLGIWDVAMKAIHDMDLYFICALGLGVAGGTLICTKILETAMAKYPRGTYSIVCGFVVASLVDVYIREIAPKNPDAGELLCALLFFAAGASALYLVGKRFAPEE